MVRRGRVTCVLAAALAAALGGCGGEDDAATTAPVEPAGGSTSAPASRPFAVDLPRTADVGRHDARATFVSEKGRTRVIVDFDVPADTQPVGGLPTKIRHGSCAELGALAYALDESTGLTQTVIDVPTADLLAGFEAGSFAVAIERSRSNDEIVACGDAVTG